MSRWGVALRVGQVLAGLIAGGGLAEGVFRLRDRGAFPHVNCYVPDARLGVRLRPGATERIAFGGNPVTRIRINRDGYRGADLPPPRDGEILVVGDSQAFGLGVEEQETFAARLGALTGRPVVNGGVPTYGPAEYDAVVEEMLARRRPSAVVYAINVANDLFEAERPNRQRHAVADGWAIRVGGTPPSARWFPGRELLFGRSHLIFALRKLWYERGLPAGGPAVDRGLPSEGSWADLVGAGAGAERAHVKARDALREERHRRLRLRAEAEARIGKLEPKIAGAVDMTKLGLAEEATLDGLVEGEGEALLIARSSVGDIVELGDGEESRSTEVTADILQRAAALQRKLKDALRRRGRGGAGGRHDGDGKAADEGDRDAELAGMLEDWDRSAAELRALNAAPAQFLRHSSPLLPHIERLKALCEAHKARLYVLVLPLDVMVSDGEWAKYGARPRDMSAARVLLDDLTRASEEIGVSALDASAALGAAEPGAFLNHDIHMTAKGHDAVARALAAQLGAPPPEVATGQLRAGRYWLPDAGSWAGDSQFIPAASKANCHVSVQGSWVRVYCYHGKSSTVEPRGVTLLEGGHGDAMTFTTPRAMLLITPQLANDRVVADFAWSDAVQHMELDEHGRFHFTRLPPREGAAGPTPLEQKLLACWKQEKRQAELKGRRASDPLQLGADPDCERTYGDDCERLVECASGDPGSPPDCPRGAVSIGPLGRCHALCGPDRPCARGTCTAWPGAHVCE